MKIQIFENDVSLSIQAAEQLITTVAEKPEAVLCLAGGESPLKTYRWVVQLSKQNKVEYSKVHFIGLDEWVGIPPENKGSCKFFLRENILKPLSIKHDHFHLFDSMAEDLNAECQKMDKTISLLGGIDLMIVGIGMNGHIGFNEPGVSLDLTSHVVQLDEITQTVGQKYFSQKTHLSKGITIGFRHLMESRKVLLMASGLKKADIVQKTLEGEIAESIPASIIRTHPGGLVLLDKDSASKLTNLPTLAQTQTALPD